MIFFVAGFETVSTTLAFTLQELATHPEVQDRLLEEIKEYDKAHGGRLDYSSMLQMPYLDMVISGQYSYS